jgi:hypothetical protein
MGSLQIGQEILNRSNNMIARNLKDSALPPQKTLEMLDRSLLPNPSSPVGKIKISNTSMLREKEGDFRHYKLHGLTI